MTYGYKAVATATTDWQQVIYILYMCERARPRQERVEGGGGGRRHLYNRLYNGVNIHELIHFYSWGGGGEERAGHEEYGRRGRSV
jgi:hypothetical protein